MFGQTPTFSQVREHNFDWGRVVSFLWFFVFFSFFWKFSFFLFRN